MDISSAAAAATTSSVKTPESEPAPTQIQPSKPIPLTNGVLKRHHHLHHHRGLPAVVVTYKECLKNHAAASGGHAVDGCCEFMPSPTASPADPTSLTCDACGCHRNFHRRDPEEPLPPSTAPAQHVIEYQPHHRHRPPPPPSGRRSPNSASPPPISSTYYPSAPHMLLALGGGGVSGPPPENTNPAAVLSPNGRKRRRSKFTADQKQRMWEFAERIGWKMQRREEEAIADFCGGVGVEKRVFKVWMHNHKGILVKRDVNSNNDNGGSVSALAGAANGSSSSC